MSNMICSSSLSSFDANAISSTAAYAEKFQSLEQTPSAEVFYKTMLANGVVPHVNEADLSALYGSNSRDLSNREIRDLYNHIVKSASKVIGNHAENSNESDLRDLAISASSARHAARHYTRSRGPLASSVYTYARDLLVYGNFNGPSIDSILKKYDNDYMKIIGSSGRTNKAYNH